ncbi:phosphonate ABC transporter ATP-binding protein [Hoeflea poritis]|uniref:ATP-binding cassette domain-containing protein n=1 Tax=Hoeflea poritis TaxID=2993659 RepID=A0ABT4VQ47_9HYPH|nr:ATP-binding cassette domain-containing protein [Hoeflea poritis]MDA4846828.1 ATP-binding cassette domain-containing protein [Hoeflea poritis]
MEQDSIIRTSGFAKSYAPGVPVLRDLDIEIRPRERIALIGANGTGKSTLLKCLIGLLPGSDGTVSALGETFSGSPSKAQLRRIRLQIGFVFQHHGLVRQLSVLSNVTHGMLGYPGSWRAAIQVMAPAEWRIRAMEALSAVNLEAKALERADALSGGQQQRVAIARALIRRPRLMIADEPAASLDPSAGRDVMTVFSRLASEQGITLLYTSHDMEHAVSYSDRIIALKDGRVHFDQASSSVSQSMLSEVFDG